jgi:hypothetical protein
MSELLDTLTNVLRVIEAAAPDEQRAAEQAVKAFLKRVAYARMPMATQQQTLLSAEMSGDRQTVADLAQHSNDSAIRRDAATALAELSSLSPAWPRVQV